MPEDIYQTAKVAKVLLLLNAGKGDEFKGKKLDQIQLEENEFCSDFNNPETENAEEEIECEDNRFFEEPILCSTSNKENPTTASPIKKRSKRVSWSEEQKQIILKHFKKQIQQKKLPKKEECLALIAESGELLKGVDWSRIKILVYNSYRKK